MRNLEEKIGKLVCSLALSTAKKSVNSMCLIILYQPKVPKRLKKLY